MLLIDTSGLLSALFPDQERHTESARVLADARDPLILSPFVLAELDYLVARFGGVDVALELLREVARGAYLLARFQEADINEAQKVICPKAWALDWSKDPSYSASTPFIFAFR